MAFEKVVALSPHNLFFERIRTNLQIISTTWSVIDPIQTIWTLMRFEKNEESEQRGEVK